jgi:hypothetical protein
MIEISKMNKRLFAFGCSFTRYRWPTWADILGLSYSQCQNWGAIGGGNHFIFCSLIEAIQREKINSNDTVAIMWTSVGREDRFINNEWQLYGSIYNSPYPEEYIKNFTDPTGFFLTSVTLIDAAKKILDSIGCEYHFFSMVPFEKVDDSFLNLLFTLKKDTETEIKTLYKDTLACIKPSVFDLVFNGDWASRKHMVVAKDRDLELTYLKNDYKNCAGGDWPSFDDFLNDQWGNSSKDIVNEIENQFHLISRRNNITTTGRTDYHPVPTEHAEYLQALGFKLTDQQLELARSWTDKILADPHARFSRPEFDRFKCSK